VLSFNRGLRGDYLNILNKEEDVTDNRIVVLYKGSIKQKIRKVIPDFEGCIMSFIGAFSAG
jgi:hypothetical protein